MIPIKEVPLAVLVVEWQNRRAKEISETMQYLKDEDIIKELKRRLIEE